MAARPYRDVKGERRPGVPVREEPLPGVVGVRGLLTLSLFLIGFTLAVDIASESRRPAFGTDDVESERAEDLRERGGA